MTINRDYWYRSIGIDTATRNISRPLLLFVLIAYQSGVHGEVPNRVPEPLVRAHESRMSIRTGVLRYKQTRKWMNAADQARIFDCKFAGDDLSLSDRGNEDGVVSQNPDGTPLFGVQNTFLPDQRIIQRSTGKTWKHWGSYTHVSCHQIDDGPLFIDPRIIGLHYAPFFNKTPKDMLELWLQQKGGVFHEFDDGELVRVTLEEPRANESGTRMEWIIDPAKDFAILRINLYHINTGGSEVLGCRLTSLHEQVDGRWWPRRTESLCPENGIGFLWEIEHAEFNNPRHPKVIDPDMLGMPPGTMIVSSEFRSEDSPWGIYLGGGQVVSTAEWEKIKNDYDETTLKDWKTRCASSGSGAYPAWWEEKTDRLGIEGSDPGEWDAYVRRWIMKHSNGLFYQLAEPLDEKQKTSARSILADCKKRAISLAGLREKELNQVSQAATDNQKVATELRMQPPSKSLNEKITRAEMEAILARRLASRLENPDTRVAEIFLEMINRLDDLLTAKQHSSENVISTHLKPHSEASRTSTDLARVSRRPPAASQPLRAP